MMRNSEQHTLAHPLHKAWLHVQDSLNLTLLTTAGGRGVYRARSILGHFDPNTTFSDQPICNNLGVYKGNSEIYDVADPDALIKASKNIIKVFPNPASKLVTFEYSLDKSQGGVIELFDVYGRKRLVVTLDEGSSTLNVDVAMLENGIYLYKFLVDSKEEFTGKVLIEK